VARALVDLTSPSRLRAADLAPFVAALTAHARHRVVLELTASHPQTSSTPQ